MALSKYIREKSTGQAYELTPGGYYKAVAAPTPDAQVQDVNSMTDAYTNDAEAQYGEKYKAQADQMTYQGNQDAADLENKLKTTYANRGLLDSTYYTQDVTKAATNNQLDLRTKLANLLQEKNTNVNNRVNQLQGIQQTGNAYENNLVEQERQRQRDLVTDQQKRIDEQAARDWTRSQNETVAQQQQRQYEEEARVRAYNEQLRQAQLQQTAEERAYNERQWAAQEAQSRREFEAQQAKYQAEADNYVRDSQADTDSRTAAQKLAEIQLQKAQADAQKVTDPAVAQQAKYASEISAAMKSPAKYVGATATSNREGLIRALIAKYGDYVDPLQIAEQVYMNIRSSGEKEYKGMSQAMVDAINNGTF